MGRLLPSLFLTRDSPDCTQATLRLTESETCKEFACTADYLSVEQI